MKIAIIGLGYVGLPLFCLMSKYFHCIGLDTDNHRILQLKEGVDYRQCEKRNNIRLALQGCQLTYNYSDISDCNVYIVCVPTGIDERKRPDLRPLKQVCKSLSKILKNNNLVVFESTVFPGAIDDVCIPLLEECSHKKVNQDFMVGYSPERINVGDKEHRTNTIPKIISGSCEQALNIMDELYSTIIEAPIVRASSIKVAEAAKMYENVQRDVLIALANEYSDFCKSENISIDEVTECAASKWNFAKVSPGLVGGHCIGVDTYYLLQRAKETNQSLTLVQTAREINEIEPTKIANRISAEALSINARSILLLGFSYKPNTPDCRNTKVSVVYKELLNRGFSVDCYDPLVEKNYVQKTYGISLTCSESLQPNYDLVVKLVNHNVFDKMSFSKSKLISLNGLL